MKRIDLTPIAAQPGVVSAFAIRAGHVLAAAGRHAEDAAVLGVLAEALHSAADELGRRTGNGDCLEIASTHDHGGLIAFAGQAGAQVIILCTPAIDLMAVRTMALEVLAEASLPAASPAAASPPPAAPAAPSAPAAPMRTASPTAMALADALNQGAP